MPKLLIVTTVPPTLQSFLLPYAEHFRTQGWRVDALANGVTQFPDCVAAFDRVWDVAWSRNPLAPAHFLSVPKFVRELVQREAYDLVHVHTPVAAFVTRFALRKLRAPGKLSVIYTAHGFHFHSGGGWFENALYKRLEKWAGPWTDRLVVINREDEKSALELGLVPAARLHYMPGIGVDLSQYARASVSEETATRLRREMNVSPQQSVILMIAEFIPRKRHRDALEAFAKLQRPQAVLAFAGIGPLEDEMKAHAAKLGLADRVRFLGYRRDIAGLIRAAQAVLLPSEREGLPRSLMEAMCLEAPCIASRIRGNADLLESGAGLLFPVGDVPALAQQLARVIDDSAYARALGQTGRARMTEYDIRRLISLHEDLYHDALGKPKLQGV